MVAPEAKRARPQRTERGRPPQEVFSQWGAKAMRA